MGSQARVVVFSVDEATAREAVTAAFDRIGELDEVMSDYQLDSELMQLCERSGGGTVEVSEDLFDVLSRASAVSEATDGAFDVTVGPIVRLWREAMRTGCLPDPVELEAARCLVDWRFVVLDSERRTVCLERVGMLLDLGGIGKGYAADEAMCVLREHGHPYALVDVGGDVVLGEAPPGGSGWSVSVMTHQSDQSDYTLTLSDCAVATSGDLERFVEIDGVRYSHLIDPRTGLGLANQVAVTVIAPDGTTADALASALSVLGAERGLEILDEKCPDCSGSVSQLVEEGESVVVYKSECYPDHSSIH